MEKNKKNKPKKIYIPVNEGGKIYFMAAIYGIGGSLSIIGCIFSLLFGQAVLFLVFLANIIFSFYFAFSLQILHDIRTQKYYEETENSEEQAECSLESNIKDIEIETMETNKNMREIKKYLAYIIKKME